MTITVADQFQHETAFNKQYTLDVQPRAGLSFSAVNPSQVTGTNSLTCYDGTRTDLTSPPNSTSFKGVSYVDLAFSYTDTRVTDNGPNKGYRYIDTVSDRTNDNQLTKYEYVVVTDLLSATTFYNAQCGTYSSSNGSGFIAGSQLRQNVFDHEQGSVLSHWTEYRDAQNNSSNNIGTVLESTVGTPSVSQQTFERNANDAGRAAISRILTAVAPEPCSHESERDSSQSCAFCGAINYSQYQSCGGATPVPYCQ